MVEITWRGSPNYSKGRGSQRPRAIVIHIVSGAGTWQATDSWFKNGASGVSAHYVIDKDGSIYQYVADTDTAWANGLKYAGGKWYTPGEGWRAVSPSALIVRDLAGVNPNAYTLSIELCLKVGEPPRAAMIQACSELVAELCTRWKIPADAYHIIRHSAINPVDRAGCPGPLVDVARITQEAAALLKPVEPVEPVEEVDWQTKFIEVLGVADHHRKTLEWIAVNSTEDHVKDRALAALNGQWIE
jgi:N-acetyl-anhydromuramyl-L-alanine amidase AmpD